MQFSKCYHHRDRARLSRDFSRALLEGNGVIYTLIRKMHVHESTNSDRRI